MRAHPRTVAWRGSDRPEKGKVETMSVAFTREESTETAAGIELPDRPISPHPNLVTAPGLEALTNAMRERSHCL
jgi:hypothetical protein